MIKYYHDNDNGGLKYLSMEGNIKDLAADIMLLTNLVYGSLHSKNKLAAKEFKTIMTSLSDDEDLQKHVFDESLVKAAIGSDDDDDDDDEEDRDADDKKEKDEEDLKKELRNILKKLMDS